MVTQFNSHIADSEDFTPSDPQTITFPSTAMVNDENCVDYQIVGDDFKELDETLTIDLVGENPVDMIAGDSQVTVTIEDDQDCKSCNNLTTQV